MGKLCKAVHFLGSGLLNYSLQNHDAISSTFDNSQTNYSKLYIHEALVTMLSHCLREMSMVANFIPLKQVLSNVI